MEVEKLIKIEVKTKRLKLRKLIVLFVTFLIIGCSSEQPLNKAWFVIDNIGYQSQAYYRSIHTFSPDSLSINFLGGGEIRTKIKWLNDSIIETDSLKIAYQFDHDTLKLQWPQTLQLPQTTLKLLPFEPKQVETSIEELKKLFIGKNWIYEYEDVRFDATFLKERYAHDEYYSQIQVYYYNKFERILPLPLWRIEKLKNQLILIIEDPLDQFHSNVFYINDVLENGSIKAEAWKYGSKYDVTFSNKVLIDSVDLLKKRKQLVHSWKLESSSEFKKPEIDSNDTTLLELGPLPIQKTINMKTVIEEFDLINGNIILNLSPDSSYQLLKGKSVVCNGTWELLRNGRIVKLTANQGYSDEHQTECNDFLVKKLTDEILQIEQWIPVYENDSIIPERYYELNMVKNTDKN